MIALSLVAVLLGALLAGAVVMVLFCALVVMLEIVVDRLCPRRQ